MHSVGLNLARRFHQAEGRPPVGVKPVRHVAGTVAVLKLEIAEMPQCHVLSSDTLRHVVPIQVQRHPRSYRQHSWRCPARRTSLPIVLATSMFASYATEAARMTHQRPNRGRFRRSSLEARALVGSVQRGGGSTAIRSCLAVARDIPVGTLIRT